mmetsp:Transcript_17864/g.50800  ORF Transcript_17864/g.50800 Transcript_17864/m.50800 type:complete len:283 (+) Transcript_17864:383-1231(+)
MAWRDGWISTPHDDTPHPPSLFRFSIRIHTHTHTRQARPSHTTQLTSPFSRPPHPHVQHAPSSRTAQEDKKVTKREWNRATTMHLLILSLYTQPTHRIPASHPLTQSLKGHPDHLVGFLVVVGLPYRLDDLDAHGHGGGALGVDAARLAAQRTHVVQTIHLFIGVLECEQLLGVPGARTHIHPQLEFDVCRCDEDEAAVVILGAPKVTFWVEGYDAVRDAKHSHLRCRQTLIVAYVFALLGEALDGQLQHVVCDLHAPSHTDLSRPSVASSNSPSNGSQWVL